MLDASFLFRDAVQERREELPDGPLCLVRLVVTDEARVMFSKLVKACVEPMKSELAATKAKQQVASLLLDPRSRNLEARVRELDAQPLDGVLSVHQVAGLAGALLEPESSALDFGSKDAGSLLDRLDGRTDEQHVVGVTVVAAPEIVNASDHPVVELPKIDVQQEGREHGPLRDPLGSRDAGAVAVNRRHAGQALERVPKGGIDARSTTDAFAEMSVDCPVQDAPVEKVERSFKVEGPRKPVASRLCLDQRDDVHEPVEWIHPRHKADDVRGRSGCESVTKHVEQDELSGVIYARIVRD